jgi:hypothetical protein
MPVLFVAVGGTVDYSFYTREKARLQSVTDAAAIASAREMQMAKADERRITAVAEAFVQAREPGVSIQTQVDVPALAVTVVTQKSFDPIVGKFFWLGAPSVKASATAKLNGSMPLCLLALDRRAAGTIHLETSALMTAPGCMVYSDSKSASGVQAKDNASLTAGLICSAGGKGQTSSAKFTPDPVLDCPKLDDPLTSRSPPDSSGCRFNDTVISGGSQILRPGIYCKGLKITNGADVTLSPGIYVIKDGPLIVDKGGSMQGADVGIYLKGKGANLTFDSASTISISAPKDGPMAGLLIFDDPTGASAPAIPPFPLPLPIVGQVLGGLLKQVGSPREHKILSDNARNLLGTIYMPQGRLIIDASKPIADKSAYTVLVVERIDLHDGPNLYLNSNYSASEVPVPNGVGPYGSKVMLTN